jgi:hypothetical protein
MHILPSVLVAMLAAAPAAAAMRDYPAQGFTAVELKSAAEVTISAGPRFSVHADGDPRLLQRLTADVRGDTLILGWTQGGSVQVANQHIHVTITMPRVSGAAISGAGTIAIDRVQGPGFDGSVGGAGTIRIAQLQVMRTALDMGGTGQIIAAGRTARIDASVSGVGAIDAANLAAGAGKFAMSGAGRIRARVNGPADVSLSGMGNVVVTGNPRCTVRKSGLGSVSCG